jgi:hypothetical protein
LITFTKALHSQGCQTKIPGGASLLTNSGTNLDSDATVVVCQGAKVTFTGTDNLIFYCKGTSGSIMGTGNRAYVAPGVRISVIGTNNTIYSCKGSSVSMMGVGNKNIRCDEADIDDSAVQKHGFWFSSKKKSTPSTAGPTTTESEQLTEAPAKMDKKTQKTKKSDVPEAEADPSNNLIGTWDVVKGSYQGIPVSTKGKIILYKNGAGLQDYTVEAGGMSIPQLGVFKWRSDDSFVHVNEDDDYLKWKRLINKKDIQKVELTLSGEYKVTLELKRIK